MKNFGRANKTTTRMDVNAVMTAR